MGIFRKTKDKKIENENNNISENIEILDFSTEAKKTDKQEIKRENRILLIILVIVILIVVLLPQLTSWLNKKSIFSYTDAVEDIINTKTVDGMLPIGETDGTITVKKIRFYNPTKKSNNEISIVYLPETGVKNIKDLKIYIELFNSNKTSIFRTQFISGNLERRVQGLYSIPVNETIYKDAKYLKVTIIKDEDYIPNDDTLICTKRQEDEDFNVYYKVTYNFSNKGLITYQVNKTAYPKTDNDLTNNEENNTNDETNNNINQSKYQDIFEKEAQDLEKTNIKDIFYNENMLEYTVSLIDFDSGKSDYKVLYELGSVKRQIKLGEESNNWSCD